MNTSSLSMYSFGEPWREFWPHVLMGAKFTPHLHFLPSVALVKTGLLRASVPPAERVVNPAATARELSPQAEANSRNTAE